MLRDRSLCSVALRVSLSRQSAANASTTDPPVPEQKETPWFVNAAKLIGDGSKPNFSKHPGRVLYALRAQ
jgi:hypothetical protein